MKSFDVRGIPARLGLALLAAGLGSACAHNRDYSSRDTSKDTTNTRQASSSTQGSSNRGSSGESGTSLPAGYQRDPNRPIGEQGQSQQAGQQQSGMTGGQQQSGMTGQQQSGMTGGQQQSGMTGGQQQQQPQRSIENNPSAARFARTLPSFTLQDPLGQRHDKDTVIGGGKPVVFVVTAPTLGSGGDQKDWNDALVKSAPAGAKVILIEDMSQSNFKGRALDRMRKDFEPNGQTLLLLDDQGTVRKQLGVGEGETVVLVYDAQGNLVHADQSDASVERARQIWSAAQSSYQKGNGLGQQQQQQPMIERDR
jgi:hypothetical protein